jgi:hypothetical protein
MDFSQVRTGKRKEPFRVVVYGGEGIGKSTWAAKAPNPIFFDIEDGIAHIESNSWDLSKQDFDTIINGVIWLLENEHDFKTVVIDSIDWLEYKIWEKVVNSYEKKINSIQDIGYAKGYDFAVDHFKKFLRGMDRLRKEKKMNVIFIAHGIVVRVDAPDHDPYDKWELKLHKKVRSVCQEWADAVFFAKKKQFTKKSGESFGEATYKMVDEGYRILCTQDSPAYYAKSRYELPNEIRLDSFDSFLSEYEKINHE